MPGHTFPGDPHFLAIPRSYRNHPNGEFPLCGREWNKLPGWWLWGQVFHGGLTTSPPHTGNPAVREGVHTHTRVALLSGRGYTQSPASQAQVREDREALVTDCRRAAWGRPFHPSTSQGLVKREEMQDLQGIIPSSSLLPPTDLHSHIRAATGRTGHVCLSPPLGSLGRTEPAAQA